MKLIPRSRIALALLLCLVPVVVLLMIRFLEGIDAQTAQRTQAAIPLALAGGIVAGALAEALVNRSRGTMQTLLGLALTAGIGVLTIGYIYLIHIRGPLSSIGTFSRAVEQVIPFVAFLTAQGGGILLAPVVLPSRKGPDRLRGEAETQRED